LWNEFKRWLRTEEIVITFDFIQYTEWLWLISDDQKYIKIKKGSEIVYLQQTDFSEVYKNDSEGQLR